MEHAAQTESRMNDIRPVAPKKDCQDAAMLGTWVMTNAAGKGDNNEVEAVAN